MTDTLESALRERQQLTRAYRASKKAQFERAFAEEPRLKRFSHKINRLGIDDARWMIALCRETEMDWLGSATTSPETRALALEIVSLRIQQIRTRAGLVPIDDALPWEADDVFQIVKRILG